VPFDAQSAWARLGAHVASKPSHGRQELLSVMAQIADECTMEEEVFQRALRLAMPTLLEALFDPQGKPPEAAERPSLPVAKRRREGDVDAVEGRHSIAAV
jgi:hypothetical protein